MKTCRSCKIEKPLDEFHKASKTPDGRQYRCKVCSVSAARQRALDNPDGKREADRKYSQSAKAKANRKRRREGPQREVILQQKRESWYRNHDANLEKLRDRQSDPEFRAKQRARHERWRQAHPRAEHQRHIRKLYGLTLAEYDILVLNQEGRCAICEEASPRLDVDHCHRTGAVRSLLCHLCNRGLGLFRDDPQLLIRAVEYLSNVG